MARTKEANQRLVEKQRLKIMESARKAFANKGMAATMADIAAIADVSQGLAYRYFSSKELIFKELVEQSLKSGYTTLQYIMEMSGTPSERIRYLVSSILETRYESLEVYQLYNQVINDEKTPYALLESLRKHEKFFTDVVKQLIIEGQSIGEIAEGDPDQLVIVIITCLDGLSRLALYQPEQFKGHFPYTQVILRILKP